MFRAPPSVNPKPTCLLMVWQARLVFDFGAFSVGGEWGFRSLIWSRIPKPLTLNLRGFSMSPGPILDKRTKRLGTLLNP